MYRFTKRLFDLTSSISAVIILSPLILFVAIVIFIDDPGPVIFKQKRVGKDNKLFTIYKFRSMKINTPNIATNDLDNMDNYLTRFGSFLRKSSLDEIPQLINIIKGEMSIVGPRPALYNQTKLIRVREKNQINKIKPGLTGLAQVNGRDNISIVDKVNYDLEYLSRMNFMLDMFLIMKTIYKVFRKSDIKG